MSKRDEPDSVFTGHYEVEIVVDRPAKEVWKHVVNISSWVTSHEIMPVDGPPDAIGGITRVSPQPPGICEQLGFPRAHYHYCKIIVFVPERHYVLKTYSEQGGSYGMEISAFDDIRLSPAQGKTKVTFNLFCEYRGDAVAKAKSSMNLDASRDGMQKNLENLKRIVESA